jgi:hypothetical protein
MGIDSYITDPQNHKNAHVNAPEGECQGLVTYTHPLKNYENTIKFFTNSTYGINMNLGVILSLTEVIYAQNIEWTTSAISGTWVFNSPGVGAITPHGGSVCINAVATVDNNTAQFARGSSLTLTNYTVLTGWIAISDWDDRGTKGIQVYGWNTATDTIVGNLVDLRNYINIGTITTWQKFSIPLADMNLTGQTINALRVRTVDIGPGTPPDYFLDDIQWEGAGPGDVGATDFIVEPDLGTWLHVYSFNVSLANNIAGTLADGTMPGLSYDTFLGLDLSSGTGIAYQRIINREIALSLIFKNLGDWFQLPKTTLETAMSDGTNTFVSLIMETTEPLILKPENNDKLRLVISDNLSTLLWFRVSAGCKIEYRT